LRGRNLAQVSINLTDFEQTPIHRVFDNGQARSPNATASSIVGSEIVGLIPKAGYRTDRWTFICNSRTFRPRKCLRTVLKLPLRALHRRKGPENSRALARNHFLDAGRANLRRLPAEAPWRRLQAALGASLGQMVAGLSRKKKSQAALCRAAQRRFGGISFYFARAGGSD